MRCGLTSPCSRRAAARRHPRREHPGPRPAAEGQLVRLRPWQPRVPPTVRGRLVRRGCLPKRVLWLVGVAIVCGCCASAAKDEPDVVALARYTLFHAETFSTGPVGLGQGRSAEVKAFAVLLSRSDAPQTFQDFVRDATPVGKLYGLCGLYLVDKAAYDAALPDLAASQDVVRYQRSCEVFQVPVSTLIRKPSAESWRFDISSGQFPEALRAYAGAEP